MNAVLGNDLAIMKIIVGIVIAMRFMHSRDVVHGDLKPANILLDDDWLPLIADFGSATTEEMRRRIMETGRGFGGTPFYLAPECYKRQGFGTPADVFSFGIIVYELLAGKLPYPDGVSRQEQILAFIEAGKWDFPEVVTEGAKELVCQCLRTDPGSRPTFAELLERFSDQGLWLSDLFRRGPRGGPSERERDEINTYIAVNEGTEESLIEGLKLEQEKRGNKEGLYRFLDCNDISSDVHREEPEVSSARVSPTAEFAAAELWESEGNVKNAEEHYRNAAEAGHCEARLRHGLLLLDPRLTGRRARRDLSVASQYFRLAADQGSGLAHLNYIVSLTPACEHKESYGRLYGNEVREYLMGQPNIHGAIDNVMKGYLLETGLGVVENYVEAAKCYARACKSRHSEGLWRYGICHLHGIGVEKDLEQAVKFMKRSADQGYALGQCGYGICCIYGLGCPMDEDSAEKYLRLSADSRNIRCMCEYAEFQMRRRPRAYDKAFEAYESYVKRSNDGRTHFGYGICLLNGLGVKKDEIVGIAEVKIAARSENSWAEFLYSELLRMRKGGDIDAETYRKQAFAHGFNEGVYEQAMQMWGVPGVPELKGPEVPLLDLRGWTDRGALGNSAHVNLYENDESHQVMAVKVLKSGDVDDSPRLHGQLLLQWHLCDHPRILKIYGFGLPSNGDVQIGMEFMAGGSLAQLLESGPLNIGVREKMIVGIVLGMCAMETVGVIHRDLKPGTILLNEAQEPSIGDFLSSKLQESSFTGTMDLGTPGYMAPELSEPYFSIRKADVFSFGAILFEIYTGRLAFPGDRDEARRRIKSSERPSIPTDIAAPVRNLIQSCWLVDPNNRPSFQEIRAMLEKDRNLFFPGANLGPLDGIPFRNK